MFDDDGEYDVVAHMTDDPVDFYTNGYGGFGYDTSHVAGPEPHSELYRASAAGDLAKVQSIVSETSPSLKLQVLNHARKWTEVDYRASGFTKEYEWFDLTPLLVAVQKGHVSIVKYLLEQGADPTLQACPEEDLFVGCEGAAETAMTEAKRKIFNLKRIHAKDTYISDYECKAYLPHAGKAQQSLQDRAKELIRHYHETIHGQEVIKMALKHWGTTKTRNGARYGTRTFQLPPKFDDLQQALAKPGDLPDFEGDETASEELVKVLHGLEELAKRKRKG